MKIKKKKEESDIIIFLTNFVLSAILSFISLNFFLNKLGFSINFESFLESTLIILIIRICLY